MGKIEIIGHRGYSARAPENTLVSLDAALTAGAPAVEFDVHVASGGTPVVIHDETLDRTTDGEGGEWHARSPAGGVLVGFAKWM